MNNKMVERERHAELAIEVAEDIADDLIPTLGVALSAEVFDKLADVFATYEEASLLRLAKDILNARRKRRNGTDRCGETDCNQQS